MGEVVLGQAMAEVVGRLREEGVTRQVLLMRHSARNYSGDPRLEPFMGLTEEGKHAAIAFGRALGALAPVTPCSSYIGRCIETAYLLQRGSGCLEERLNTLQEVLSPFYVKDFKKIMALVLEHGVFGFIRRWLDGEFSGEVISPAFDTAAMMLQFAEAQLFKEASGLTIGVTHDWNIFALKEFVLRLPHETWGQVAYLEGVVFFHDGERLMAVNHQRESVVVDDILRMPKKVDLVHG